jgi:hypothetical protein
MIGTSFPPSIGTGTTGTTFPASIGTTGTTGTTFPPSIGNRAGPRSQVDDRHHLPGCRSTRPARLGTTAAVASRGPG